MRCEPIGRGGRWRSRLFAVDIRRTKTERGHPLSLSLSGLLPLALPLRPLLLLRHPPPPPPPPPATARIQSLHINPAHNSHFPVWATLRLACLLPLPLLHPPPPAPHPQRERKGIGISKGKRSWKAREGRRRDDDSRLLSIGLSFQPPPAFNWHSLPWREKESAPYVYIYVCIFLDKREMYPAPFTSPSHLDEGGLSPVLKEPVEKNRLRGMRFLKKRKGYERWKINNTRSGGGGGSRVCAGHVSA